MVIQYVICNGFWYGVFVGFGVVIVDVIYVIIVIFGVIVVMNFIEGQFDLIEVVGGVLLILFGLWIWIFYFYFGFEFDGLEQSYLVDLIVVFFLVIINLGVVLVFIVIFGVLGDYCLVYGDYFGVMMMVGGVVVGVMLWWFFVLVIVICFKLCIDDVWFDCVNYIVGFFLVVFGGLIYLKFVVEMLF